ncbi:MAG: hypothetical protein LUE12_06405 [Ruminococcus sp.]|nr:hypothetical protein [Ruminococcus sp.]
MDNLSSLKTLTNIVPYSKLSSFPLGEYKRKVIETKYQYKSNIFSFSEDNYDFILSMLLQSAARQESLIIIDPERKLFSGTKRFFKDKNYSIYRFSTEKSKEYDGINNSYNLWEKANTSNNIRLAAECVVSTFLYTHMLNDNEAIKDAAIALLSAVMSYTVTFALLKSNKFSFAYELLKTNTLEQLKLKLQDVNDTTDLFLEETKMQDKDMQAYAYETLKEMFRLLSKKENNELLSMSDFEPDIISSFKSAAFFEYAQNKSFDISIDILLFITFYANFKRQEAVKGRSQAINVVLNKLEMLNSLDMIDSMIALARKYKVNFFVSCNDSDIFTSSFEAIKKRFPYILIRKPLDLKNSLDITTRFTSPSDEILISANTQLNCKKYDASSHDLYELFYR